jgi:hypothetical protein
MGDVNKVRYAVKLRIKRIYARPLIFLTAPENSCEGYIRAARS